jgi:hypothetical protein
MAIFHIRSLTANQAPRDGHAMLTPTLAWGDNGSKNSKIHITGYPCTGHVVLSPPASFRYGPADSQPAYKGKS